MRNTTNLGFPVPEEGDPKSAFPLGVEAERWDALDMMLWPAAAKGGGGTVPVTTSWAEVPVTWDQASPTITVSGTGLEVPNGLYLVNLRYNVSNSATAGYVHWRWGGGDIGGDQTIASIGNVWATVTCVVQMGPGITYKLSVVGSPARSVSYHSIHVCQLTPDLLTVL